MRYIFHPEALAEYKESAVYYSKISRVNLEDRPVPCPQSIVGA
jgi:hypothetical protein